MIITNKLKMDLLTPGCTPIIHAAQNDQNTRKLEITLLAEDRPLQIPPEAAVLIRYQSRFGGGGTYDALDTGAPAWSLQGNVLTVTLIPRMFALPGTVGIWVTLLSGQLQLGSFPIRLYVCPSSLAAPEGTPETIHITDFLPAPAQAAAGQLFLAEGVDEWGTVTAVSAVNPEDLWNRDADDAYISQYLEDYFSRNIFLTQESDPTVPAWAKAAEKPAYTAPEVGALPDTTPIPAALSDLTNDCGFITKAAEDLEAYYRKSETYSREELDQKISAIPKFSVQVVSALPETGISETAIYLVPGGDGANLYTEYIHAGGAWELLGSQQLDLTGYATETWVGTRLSDYQPKGDYVLAGEISTLPDAVAAEAARVTDAALTREDTRILRFLAIADAHQKNDNTAITAATTELGQAVGEVLKQIGVDFVALLGDMTWGASDASTETVLEEGKTFNRLVSDGLRGETQIWTEGNHETNKLTPAQIQTLIYSHNKTLTQDADHWIEGYGYMDLPNRKVRVICLNTNQSTGSDASGVGDAQLKWFAETALNMADKTDWSVLTLGHHPMGFNNVTLFKNCATVLEAFIARSALNFTTNGGTALSADYSGYTCPYIGHFHGHVHSYTMLPIQKYVSSGVYEELDAWEVCIPNACCTRTDQYSSTLEDGDYLKRYCVGGINYERPEADGQRTAFTLVTVCLDSKQIYADDYGIVPPNVRSVSYDFAAEQTYTNQIPISTDTDGSIYNGIGYKTDTYLSGGNTGTRAGVETTGFIPFDGSGCYEIYLSGVTATQTDGNFRIMLYDSGKTYHSQFASSNWTSNSYAPVTFETDADGNITKVDLTATATAIETETAYFRLCASHIDSSSVITVNEPIA